MGTSKHCTLPRPVRTAASVGGTTDKTLEAAAISEKFLSTTFSAREGKGSAFAESQGLLSNQFTERFVSIVIISKMSAPLVQVSWGISFSPPACLLTVEPVYSPLSLPPEDPSWCS